MTITNNIRFFFDITVSFSINYETLYIDSVNAYNHHDGHFVSICKRRLENGQTVFDIAENIRDMMGRIMNNNNHRAFKLTFCQICRHECYYKGQKKAVFSIKLVFSDDSSRAGLDIQVDFPTRALAREHFKVIKDCFGIKKGFK